MKNKTTNIELFHLSNSMLFSLRLIIVTTYYFLINRFKHRIVRERIEVANLEMKLVFLRFFIIMLATSSTKTIG